MSYQRLKPLASCFIDDLLASPTYWLHASHGLYTGLNSGYPIPTMSFQHSPSALRDAGLLEALCIPTFMPSRLTIKRWKTEHINVRFHPTAEACGISRSRR
ncbi:MAG: hypothetical protein ACTSV0_03095 [Candidatus Freyarchaeota archaeon]